MVKFYKGCLNNMPNSLKYIYVLIITLAIAMLAYWWIYESKQASAMKNIKLGDSVDKVITIARATRYETNGTESAERNVLRNKNELIPGCVRELWYKAQFSPFPSKWSYCFNEKDQLINKYHWSSW